MLLVILLTLVAMARLTGADFTSWDDYDTIARNPNLNPPTFESLGRLWTTEHMHLWVPLTYMVWWAVAGGAQIEPDGVTGIALNPTLFHGVNVLIHIGVTLAVFGLLRALRLPHWPAAIGAALFGVHPVQVETVGWTSGTKDLLCGLFSVLALTGYVRAAQRSVDDDTTKRVAVTARRAHLVKPYAWATLALVAAMLSKPTAMVVPVMAFVVDALLIGRPVRRAAVWLAPWVLLSIACAIAARLVQPIGDVSHAGPLVYRPLVALDAVAFYIGKLLWPMNLAVDYGRTPHMTIASGSPFVTWVVPVALLAVALWAWRKHGQAVPLVALAIFAIGVGPVIGLVSYDFQRLSNVADHYLYLPMIGVALLVAFAMSRASGATGAVRPIWRTVAAVLLVVLAVRSAVQAGTWRDTASLFNHVLRVNPTSGTAYNSLATLAVEQRRPTDAIPLAERAVQHAPKMTEAWVTLGAGYAMTGDMARATAAYRKAVEVDPNEPRALAALGGATAMLGDFDAATPMLQKAIAIDPSNAQAQLNLGTIFAQLGRFNDAVPHLRAATELNGHNPQAWTNLGIALARTGQHEEAARCFQTALRINPQFTPARNELEMLGAK